MSVAEWGWVILLGVVQGITEFLPISSDGHLTLLQGMFRAAPGSEQPAGAAMEMVLALHVGTLASIVAIYWNDLWALPRRPKLCAAIVLATIPVGLIGFCFKAAFEETFESPLIAGLGFLVTAAALWIGHYSTAGQAQQVSQGAADATSANTTPPGGTLVGWRQALWIGVCQVFALFPGISRSGTTIAAGLTSGLDRVSAARFSFLIAVPAILGATVLQAKDVWEQGGSTHPAAQLIVGAVTAGLVGYMALTWLIRLVSQRRLHWFAYYCTVLGVITITWQAVSPTAPQQAQQIESNRQNLATEHAGNRTTDGQG